MLRSKENRILGELAAAYGVQTTYRDAFGKQRKASKEALLATLHALGAPLRDENDAGEALRETVHNRCSRTVGPVTVLWQGRANSIVLYLAAGAAPLKGIIALETGGTQSVRFDPAEGQALKAPDGAGTRAYRFKLPRLAAGYHRLSLADAQNSTSLLICAPYKAYPAGTSEKGSEKYWGVFMPTYALRSAHGIGAGDLSDLSELIRWTGSQGGSMVATLPLLAGFLRNPFDPSPYAPVSRLFWNEFYLDASKLPEFPRCTEAHAYLQSHVVATEAARLRADRLIDYRTEMGIKRKVVELLAASFFTGTGNEARRHAYETYVSANPEVEAYARFQATVESRGATWPSWPADLLGAPLEETDFEHAAYRYHLYAQWSTDAQMREVAETARNSGLGLYLDLPLGVHYDGYDVFSRRHLFALGHATGAPPDPLFTKGQNWGFPPLIPSAQREGGYEYAIRFIRSHLRYAGVLRMDHVMQLHRLFWIPKGLEAGDGLYVHYPADEMYAILALESHRHRAWIVGENLGTVPRYVNEALAAHNIQRMFVVQYEAQPDSETPLPPPPSNVVASLNTHDMPTFAGFWTEADVNDRIAMGILAESDAGDERTNRQKLRAGLHALAARNGITGESAQDVLRGVLRALARSDARMVLVNLEDLWLEEEPQNTPGTVDERPNWRRRARYGLAAIRTLSQVTSVVKEIDALRKGKESLP